jgi:hypothetical protein
MQALSVDSRIVDLLCDCAIARRIYGRAERGPTKIREIGSQVRSGAEAAYISRDGWPKTSGSPSRFNPSFNNSQSRSNAAHSEDRSA